jgi:hypothetical protein
VAYPGRELSEKDSASIAEHLLSCAACQEELEELRDPSHMGKLIILHMTHPPIALIKEIIEDILGMRG